MLLEDDFPEFEFCHFLTESKFLFTMIESEDRFKSSHGKNVIRLMAYGNNAEKVAKLADKELQTLLNELLSIVTGTVRFQNKTPCRFYPRKGLIPGLQPITKSFRL